MAPSLTAPNMLPEGSAPHGPPMSVTPAMPLTINPSRRPGAVLHIAHPPHPSTPGQAQLLVPGDSLAQTQQVMSGRWERDRLCRRQLRQSLALGKKPYSVVISAFSGKVWQLILLSCILALVWPYHRCAFRS